MGHHQPPLAIPWTCFAIAMYCFWIDFFFSLPYNLRLTLWIIYVQCCLSICFSDMAAGKFFLLLYLHLSVFGHNTINLTWIDKTPIKNPLDFIFLQTPSHNFQITVEINPACPTFPKIPTCPIHVCAANLNWDSSIVSYCSFTGKLDNNNNNKYAGLLTLTPWSRGLRSF